MAESIGYFDPTKYYSPIVYTYNGLGSFFQLYQTMDIYLYYQILKSTLGVALSKISERGKVKILMPSGNAYGTSGKTSTPEIPENSILIFDIHLIKIRK